LPVPPAVLIKLDFVSIFPARNVVVANKTSAFNSLTTASRYGAGTKAGCPVLISHFYHMGKQIDSCLAWQI